MQTKMGHTVIPVPHTFVLKKEQTTDSMIFNRALRNYYYFTYFKNFSI